MDRQRDLSHVINRRSGPTWYGHSLSRKHIDQKTALRRRTDQPLELVIERLGKSQGLSPVVSRGDLHRVQGVITPQRLIEVSPVRLGR